MGNFLDGIDTGLQALADRVAEAFEKAFEAFERALDWADDKTDEFSSDHE